MRARLALALPPLLGSLLLGPLLLGLPVTAAFADGSHFVAAATYPNEGAPAQTTFAPNAPTIFLALQLSGIDRPGDRITATWIAEKTTTEPPDYTIFSDSLTVGGDRTIAFYMTRPTAGWPPGAYRVDIRYNGQMELSRHFTVAAPQ